MDKKERMCQGFVVMTNHRVKYLKKKSEKLDKSFYLARKVKRNMECECDSSANHIQRSGYSHKELSTNAGRTRNLEKCEKHLGLNTLKNG